MLTRAMALAAAAALAPLSAAAQSNMPQPIESQPLRQLDAWSVGAISRAEGALPANLWTGVDPAVLATLFDRLPASYESPAARQLARRVLLSGGDAPGGDALAAAQKRFEALGRMGAADELSQMAAGAGAALNDPLIAQYAAQAELARGRRPEACARGRSASVGETPPPFLMRLRAYCAAATGDRAAADLALELSRGGRRATADDNWYSAVIGAVGGAAPARPPAARYDNSLATQLSIAAGLRPGANPLNASSALALVALARNEQTPQPLRAQAAALAYRRGALPPAEARAILRAIPAGTTGVPAIAVALARVEAAPGSPEAAAAMAGMLRQAANPADFTAAAVLFKDDIAALQAAPDHPSTLAFARAAVAAGDVRLGLRLVASARQAGLEEAALGPLDAALAALQGPRGETGLRAMQRRIDAAGASLARAAARDIVILGALGAPMDAALQSFLIANPPQGGARADSGAMLALAAAVDRNASGEIGLLAVVASGAGPARLDAESVERIIRALRAARLEDDARRFGAEAILAGPPA